MTHTGPSEAALRANQLVPAPPAMYNTYVIDAENAAEQARLLDQDVLLTDRGSRDEAIKQSLQQVFFLEPRR